MSVAIQLSGQLVVLAGRAVVETGPADSLLALLEALATEHPALQDALFAAPGQPRPSTVVALNGSQVRDLAGTPVPDGSRVLLLMPMAGG